MGEVYEAQHEECHCRLALKVLSRGLEDATDRARFLREGRLAASVSHPNSVYIYGTEEIEGTAVITMELLPGGTLKDRVEKDGPMPAREAVDAILQVVEGLDAAAAKGVLHRDIKPSNCFVSRDGVKIGDYGLSMSTLSRLESHLTETGTFLGTPAFASPEQVRCDPVDVRSDIYSVGATLYYLVTGHAPFQGERIGKILSSVLEKPPEPPRRLRRDIPSGLERVVLKCLQKSPTSRYSDYETLKAALAPFASGAPTAGTLGRRAVAGVIDNFIVALPLLALRAYEILGGNGGGRYDRAWARESMLGVVSAILYFGLLEGLQGASIGKAILGLKVIGPDGGPPGLGRAFLRAAAWISPGVLVPAAWIVIRGVPTSEADAARLAFLNVLFFLSLFATMRRRNGFAGIHELATGTRVIQKAAGKRKSFALAAVDTDVSDREADRIGHYSVSASLWSRREEKLLLAYDGQLRRRVWIHVLPAGSPALSSARCDLGRPGRLRWINGRRSSEECWDAYEAPEGGALIDRLQDQPIWSDVRYWLLDLAEELRTASAESSLPPLTVARLWVTPEGRMKLLDFDAPGIAGREPNMPAVQDDSEAGRRLFQEVCRISIRGPIPIPARLFLDRLARSSVQSLEEIVAKLREFTESPSAVTRGRRLSHVLLCGAIASLALSLALTGYRAVRGGAPQPMLGERILSGPVASKSSEHQRTGPSQRNAGQSERRLWLNREENFALGISLALVAGLAVFSAIVFRGGFLLRLFGIWVVDLRGDRVSRLRAGLRSLLAWSPFWLWTLVFLAVASEKGMFLSDAAAIGAAALGFLLLLAGFISQALRPERGLQDVIAGTFLVPS